MEGMDSHYEAAYMEGAASPQEKWLMRTAQSQVHIARRDRVLSSVACRCLVRRQLDFALDVPAAEGSVFWK